MEELQTMSPMVAMAGAAALAVAIYALVVSFLKWKRKNDIIKKLQPQALYNPSGSLKFLESFGDYVVRQLGLDSDSAIAKLVSTVAEGYLRDARNEAGESKDITCALVAGMTHQQCQKLTSEEILQELEICVVSYFSFHWHHATSVVDRVVSAGTRINRLHRVVLAALRFVEMPSTQGFKQQRYKDVLKSLSTKRRFYTMIEELRRIARKFTADPPDEGAVTVPKECSLRSPVILFIGGGMGAGKSTVVKHILGSSFWLGVIQDAVVVEADAFKETDVIYRHLVFMSLTDISEHSELVHQYSTEAANSLLVSALNDGRDVVFDGTMSWEPFVLQTMDMVRDIHNRRYRLGPGYKQNEDGTVIEKYWEPISEGEECCGNVEAEGKSGCKKRPYRIEFVGVTCDAHLAVVRGMRRAIVTKRGVPVKGQLRSHKMFAKSIEKYVSMVDAAKIYSTNSWNSPAELIALKDGPGKKLLIDVDTYPGVPYLGDLNPGAGSALELYKCWGDCRFVNHYFRNVVLDPLRQPRQARVRTAILEHADTSVLVERPNNSGDGESDSPSAEAG